MKIFVFDLDGVIRHWDPGIVVEAEHAHGLPTGALLGTAFESELLLSAVTGKISDDSWRDEIAARLHRQYPEADGAGAVAQWSAPEGQVIDGVVDTLVTVREHGKVCLLSNATSRLADDLRALALTDLFDHVFNSSEIGYAKPDARVFAHVEQVLGVSPDQIVYIDDGPANVEAADEHGWTAILATSETVLADLIAPYLS